MNDTTNPASELARLRWAKTSPEEKKAHMAKMTQKAMEARKRTKKALEAKNKPNKA